MFTFLSHVYTSKCLTDTEAVYDEVTIDKFIITVYYIQVKLQFTIASLILHVYDYTQFYDTCLLMSVYNEQHCSKKLKIIIIFNFLLQCSS